MKNNIKKIFNIFLVGFLMLIGQLVYWQIIAAPSLQANPANQRAWELEKNIIRGGIYDRYGEILAVSQVQEKEGQVRYYPLGEKCVHLLGYSSRRYGKSGLESSYNAELLGIGGGDLSRDLVYKILGRRKRGQDLILTLDTRLQQVAYNAFGSNKGSVVVLNPKTGEILALVSKPSFSPDNLNLQWSRLNVNEDSPLLNRAIQGLYPPGSSLKVLVAAAALEKGVTNEEEVFDCPGYILIKGRKLSCYNHVAHGKINLAQAVKVSCNATFAQLGMRLGVNGLNDYLRKMDWQGDHTLGLPLAQSSLMEGKYLSANAMAERAIGQGEVLTTPLYMASLVSAIANGGTLMRPYLVSELRSPEGKVLKKNLPIERAQLFSPAVAEKIARMMEGVVEEGTGRNANIPGTSVGGKTGTAENPHGKPHAWFIGFAQNPQIAVAIIVENGGSGGVVAAPIAREIFLNALDNK